MIFLLVCLSTISLPRCSMLAKFSLAVKIVMKIKHTKDRVIINRFIHLEKSQKKSTE